MGEVALRQVRDGQRILRFQAAVIGAATSQRGSIPRWSELVVYRMVDGSYLLSKIGRSTIAHRPDCLRVNHRMIPWERAASYGEDRIQRVPCPDCQPDLHPPLDPQLRLEITRYHVTVCPDADSTARHLTEGRAMLLMPQIVRDVLGQCAQADPCFARYAEAASEPNPLEKTTRIG